MRERRVHFARQQFAPMADKAIRARAIQARMATKYVYWPGGNIEWWPDVVNEFMKFPLGTNDDVVDAMSLIGQMLDSMATGRGSERNASRMRCCQSGPDGGTVPEDMRPILMGELSGRFLEGCGRRGSERHGKRHPPRNRSPAWSAATAADEGDTDMADGATIGVEYPGEFGNPVARWDAELRAAEKTMRKWRSDAKIVADRYTLERTRTRSRGSRDDGDLGPAQYNVLWSNTETMRPAVYGNEPKPVVQRRFKDKDVTGRLASMVLERGFVRGA